MVEPRRLIELRRRSTGRLDLPGGSLVVALSGGADSAALAYLLASTGRAYRAIHVDHRLPGSPGLLKAAQEVAALLGTGLDVVAIDVPSGPSPEGQARRARYEALLERLRPGEWLLTGHTLDDQAETVLMNLLRGSGAAGLAGIPPRSGPVARPMLGVTRSETRELAALAAIPFLDDPTNLDPGLRRNRIRLEVLPALAARFNPRLSESLARTASLLRSDEDFFQAEAGLMPLLRREGMVAVSVGVLLAVPRPVADRLLRRCLVLVRPPHPGDESEVARIRAVAAGGRKSAGLAGGVEVGIEGPLLVFRRQIVTGHDTGPVGLEVGAHLISGFEVEVERFDGVCRVAPIGSWSAVFEPDALLTAEVDDEGCLLISANGEPAWVPGRRRLGVAWYQPGTSGYLSVFAREGTGWTSSL